MKLSLLVLLLSLLLSNNQLFAQDSLKTTVGNKITFAPNHHRYFYFNNEKLHVSKMTDYITKNPLAMMEYNKYIKSARNQKYYSILTAITFVGSQIMYNNHNETMGGVTFEVSFGVFIAAYLANRYKHNHLEKAACYYNQVN